MAKLINGNGNKAIWAAQDADLIASICGNVTSIAAVGSQFIYTQEDANTIGVADGVIITKEGRRIQLDTGATDLFTIPTGVIGETSYYIIGYHLVQEADSSQICETFVRKMDNATDVIVENTFKGGATEVYVSLYRITQVGMSINSVNLLLPKLRNVTQLDSDLSKFMLSNSSTSTNVKTFSGASAGTTYTIPSDGFYRLAVNTNSATTVDIVALWLGTSTTIPLVANINSLPYSGNMNFFYLKAGTIINYTAANAANTATIDLIS